MSDPSVSDPSVSDPSDGRAPAPLRFPGASPERPDSPEFPADVIPLQYHFNMLNDEARMGGLEQAIDLSVRPGMKVLELGAGTGVLSWFAARAGAARVWCVEKLPEVAAAARAALDANPGGERVSVVLGDAFEYLPPEPVDVVICEMLHTGLLREKQVAMMGAFRQRYLARFGGPLPRLIPEATLQAVQLVEQDFGYHGYTAATPLFQDSHFTQERTRALSAPEVFQTFAYDEDLPARCTMDAPVTIQEAGTANGLRLITKNLLAITDRGVAEWIMGYLVVPLAETVTVTPGDALRVRFDYAPGEEISAFTSTLQVQLATDALAAAALAGVASAAALAATARAATEQTPDAEAPAARTA